MTQHKVTLPNGSVIRSIYKATLTIPGLPEEAREAFIFSNEDLPHFNLLSVPQLASAGMRINFHGEKAMVQGCDGVTVIEANRHPLTDLYVVQEKAPQACVLFPKSASRNQKVAFYIAAMGSPTVSTLARAISNDWIQFPGLTAAMVRNQPQSEATSRGHLDRTRSGMDSTHTPSNTAPHRSEVSPPTGEPKKTIYVDLTGRFPHVSARGIEYLMCCRCSDSGYIHVEPLRSRTSKELISAFERTMGFFRDHGIIHAKAKMDNEVSNGFREAARRLNIQVEFVPPDNHRTNPVERHSDSEESSDCIPIHHRPRFPHRRMGQDTASG
jgi:hypothetical protein